MSSQKRKVLGPVTVVIAVIGLAVIVLTGAATFFGGTKVGALYRGSADALAGGPTEVSRSSVETPDASTPHAPDAGDAGPPATP
ncbi:hypothetical protein [Comamonas sp. JC664]|uniref:hypothetical protein n=1 Tax=Comamonas sp. JC664 TaxID=2801917 RepID=UPI00174823F9|nr:hypothetical protein [Comamonas sp. JC664]MBL0698623.1 hypothetical protein [Comamonas sp. JC664]GHG78194.1 hypothetical protein GCM10012319_28470 [Comamonas sp. KCTC 72670]